MNTELTHTQETQDLQKTEAQPETQAETQSVQEPRHPIEVEIHNLLHIMDGFSKLLEQENDLLDRAKFSSIEGLQNDKNHFVKEYKAKIQLLHDRKDEFAGIDDTLAETLIVKRTAFIKLLNKNLSTLAAAKNSSRRLAQRIIDTARDTIEKKANYNAIGAMMRSNPKTATSMSFNEEL